MIAIAHRGCFEGPSPDENSTSLIYKSLEKGFDVEIDVWFVNNKFMLGHNEPVYEIDINFLANPNLWCHAKNIPALYQMMEMNVHCFYHQEDDVTLTSRGFIWTFPGQPQMPGCICVMPENGDGPLPHCYGVCSDYASKYRDGVDD